MRRFGATGALARRKCSANLEVCRPPEVQWKPPLRQAAGTLCVSRESVVDKSERFLENLVKNKL
jgi:hypothetical protein